jgi:hypothetical protein
MNPVTTTLLFILSFVIVILLVRYLKKREQYKQSVEKAAEQLDERSRRTVAAYEHYFDCGIPGDLLPILMELNLIKETIHPHKYVITRKGFDVGVKLELFGFPQNVFPA